MVFMTDILNGSLYMWSIILNRYICPRMKMTLPLITPNEH